MLDVYPRCEAVVDGSDQFLRALLLCACGRDRASPKKSSPKITPNRRTLSQTTENTDV